mmetsp:Transcript_16297/g.24559  ORF Transcript_16297/g.24559 Transcript_16297/m.24559 type:complete len:299 (+) Transcript_16297:49-945(+)
MSEEKNESAKIVCLWTIPRACSTVFERSMMNRSDVYETFHEPRYIPFYYGPPSDRGSSRYPEFDVRETQADITAQILEMKAKAPPGSIVFIKDMAYYLLGPNGLIDRELLNQVVDLIDIHTFLIRDPRKQVRSLYKMSVDMEPTTGWVTFDPTEVGYKEIYEVFCAVKEKMDKFNPSDNTKWPTVTDADDLLANPKSTLEAYCRDAGISFEEDRMLTWEANDPKVILKWADWPGWHDSAIESTGFDTKHTTVKTVPTATEEVPLTAAQNAVNEMINTCIENSMQYYTPMYEIRSVSVI